MTPPVSEAVSEERLKELREQQLGLAEEWRNLPVPYGEYKDTAAAIDELLARREAEEWRPIETAPRDYLILVRCEPPYQAVKLGFFNGTYWHDQEQRSLDLEQPFKPYEWRYIDERRPLPAPPIATQEKRE